MGAHLGELAALGTSLCWTCSSLAFEVASRRIGSLSLNLIRLGLAFFLLTGLAALAHGQALPLDVPGASWGWLSVSGLVGFVAGDWCLFRAFATLGARLAMLIQATAPAMAALLGWAVLGEAPGWVAAVGMALTATGVAWATTARTRDAASGPGRIGMGGVLLALGGAAGQARALVLAKLGLEGVAPVTATQVRVLAGIAGFIVVMSVSRWWRQFGGALHDGIALRYAGAGAFFGPCLGVSLSMLAVSRTQAGVAASRMALPPVLLLPVAWRRACRRGGPAGRAAGRRWRGAAGELSRVTSCPASCPACRSCRISRPASRSARASRAAPRSSWWCSPARSRTSRRSPPGRPCCPCCPAAARA
jgi:drug/metabolite transporter (DMT)-like permease